MSEATVDAPEEPAARSKLPLIIGLVLAIAGGAGGFFAVQSGVLGLGGAPEQQSVEEEVLTASPLPDVSFVEVPPLLISLDPASDTPHLRFRGSLEVPSKYAAEVTEVLPRVQDVMNSYLRALEPEDLSAPAALVRLRAQMLRRIKLVVGDDRVRDLLVLEFVLN